MMESIKTVAISICVTLIVTGIFSMLLPSQSMEKVMKFSISLFFLVCIVMPFARGDFHFSMHVLNLSSTENGTEMSKQSEEYFVVIAQNKINTQVEHLLEKNKIHPQKVQSEIHISEDSSIIIKEVKIYFSDKEKNILTVTDEQVKEIIKNELELQAQIIHS